MATNTRNYFKYSPGSNALRWESNQKAGAMSIGFRDYNTGDLRQYNTQEKIKLAMGLKADTPSNDSRAMWLFKEAKIGDVIFANNGTMILLGIGIVIGPYEYVEYTDDYKHQRNVRWIANKEWKYVRNDIPEYLTAFRPDTFTRIKIYKEILASYLQAYPEYQPIFEKENVVFEQQENTTIIKGTTDMKHALNTILYGPPGTGKTFNTIAHALDILGVDTKGKNRNDIKELYAGQVEEGKVAFVTFHQSMCYEDFIEGIKPLKPSNDNPNVLYGVVPGIFKKLCKKANKSQHKVTREALAFDEAYEKYITDVKRVGLELVTPVQEKPFSSPNLPGHPFELQRLPQQ